MSSRQGSADKGPQRFVSAEQARRRRNNKAPWRRIEDTMRTTFGASGVAYPRPTGLRGDADDLGRTLQPRGCIDATARDWGMVTTAESLWPNWREIRRAAAIT